MKKVLGFVLVLTLMLPLAVMAASPAGTPSDDKNKDTSRSLVGFVFDKNDKPLPNAVVYLKNTKTLAVKTFIAENDSSYRFHGLSPNVDYEVWAEFQGKKSDTKTLSSFDTRPNTRINLRVNLQ